MSRTPLSTDEISRELQGLKEWHQTAEGQIQRHFPFKQYREGLRFVNAVAELAEQKDHHPEIELKWGEVVVAFSTHSAGGLTNLDFQLAHLVDRLER